MSLSGLNVSPRYIYQGSFSNSRKDNAGIYHGAPVAVQLLGRRLDEERILTLAEHIYKALTN